MRSNCLLKADVRVTNGMFRSFGLLGAAFVAVGLAMSSIAQAAPGFDRIVVFGDSLSDNGNAGRFSNGPGWVEQLAGRLALVLRPSQMGGSNFAVGGARLAPPSEPHNLRTQADMFLAMPRSGGRTLHIVWGGGNDLLAAVGYADAPIAVDRAVASLKSILADLVEQGATDILVPNLPDIGMTPEMRARGPRAIAEAGRLTDRFNTAVDHALADFAAAPRLQLYRLDVRAMAERARANPAEFGFVDVATPCSELASCEGYLFWDHVHPTTHAHGRLAQAAFHLVSSH